jgi:outer membrane protein assembly factor BamB
MKTLKKQFSVEITLILMLSMIISLLASSQIVSAARNYDTHSYITVNPTPIGVGQTAFASTWLDRFPPSGPGFAYPLTLWDFKVTITTPDGTIETKMLTSDAIGGAQFTYVPTDVGTYTFQTEFLGDTNPSNNDTYAPSTSNLWSLTVQQESVPHWPAAPLPTEYWQRPIEAQNREWAAIAGNWLGMFPLGNPGNINAYDTYGKFNPYTTGPGSAHIMWAKPIYDSHFGGLVGGANDIGFYSGDSYELKFEGFIMGGVYYRNIPKVNSRSGNGFQAIDLRTGKELWRSPNGDETINFGQLLRFDSLNQHGIIPYLWTTSLNAYDPSSGEWLLGFANRTSGSMFQDENGNILSYIINHNQKTMTLWNSTKALQAGQPIQTSGFGAGNPDYWRPVYGYDNYSWPAGIEWNVTIANDYADSGGIRKISPEDRIILTRGTLGANDTYPDGVEVLAGYDMDTGQLLWHKYRTGEDAILGQQSVFGYQIVPGAYVVQRQENMVVMAFDIRTGEKMWTSEPKENPWGSYFTTIGDSSIQGAYGNVYITSYDGTMYCYKVETGELLWKTFIGSSGFETPYGTWPLWGSLAVADGKVYAGTNEHSINQPMYRGEKLYCFDAYTGDILWSVYGIMMNPMISDGYLLALNSYDMQVYTFGKGPSATTASVGRDYAVEGEKVVITGMVTDVSSGTEEYTQTARFPNGVPAVSDESMSQWMEYVYMQKPLPTNTTGVEVWIDVIDSNGNYRNIGTTTSDLSGFYSFTWEPDIPGDFKVIATFAGSESYWPSYSEAAFTVGELVVTPAPTPTPESVADMYFLPVSIGMIVAIVIVLVLLVILLLRKR